QRESSRPGAAWDRLLSRQQSGDAIGRHARKVWRLWQPADRLASTPSRVYPEFESRQHAPTPQPMLVASVREAQRPLSCDHWRRLLREIPAGPDARRVEILRLLPPSELLPLRRSAYRSYRAIRGSAASLRKW